MKTKDLGRIARVRRMTKDGDARRIRENAEVTQTELGSACGVSGAAIALWESGKRRPTGMAALRYAQALDELAGIARDRSQVTVAR